MAVGGGPGGLDAAAIERAVGSRAEAVEEGRIGVFAWGLGGLRWQVLGRGEQGGQKDQEERREPGNREAWERVFALLGLSPQPDPWTLYADARNRAYLGLPPRDET